MKRDPEALQAREHDVLVIGGGIAGAWAVYEAATRGLRAALIETADFGQATSWSSLKTAHGGLRHLQRLDVAGFRESVRERRALLRIAPEIVRPVRFAVAAPKAPDRIKFLLGGLANDLLSLDRNDGTRSDRAIGSSRLLFADEANASGAGHLGSAAVFTWDDAQITHTERLLLALLRAAEGVSATVINHVRLLGSERAGAGFLLSARDAASGRDLKIRTRSVVNAAGREIENVARLLGGSCQSPPMIRGVNVVLNRDLTPRIALGAKDHGRYLFLAPWLGKTILGTSYDDGARPESSLAQDLLDAGKRAFPWAAIQEKDIAVVHSGHVPGLKGQMEPIYRSHVFDHEEGPLVSILSAKYTTARATAAKAVEALGRRLSLELSPSVSATALLAHAVPLAGSFDERLRFAADEEMATTAAEAVRGRLVEGAQGASGLA